MIALTAHLAQVGDLPVAEPLAVRLGAVEQPRDAGCGEQSVVLGFERRELFSLVRFGHAHEAGAQAGQGHQGERA